MFEAWQGGELASRCPYVRSLRLAGPVTAPKHACFCFRHFCVLNFKSWMYLFILLVLNDLIKIERHNSDPITIPRKVQSFTAFSQLRL